MKEELKIKVCGMRDPENITGVAAFSPDYLGYIFYPKSKRYVGEAPNPEIFEEVSASIQKVGVFVNEEWEKVIEICKTFGLEVAQLHGNETPEYCKSVKEHGLKVFKAFSVDDDFDFEKVEAYQDVADCFLFDTKGKLPGGTGEKYNWDILQKYQLQVPFFLSGGITMDDSASILNLEHPAFYGIDINSGFELRPALKDTRRVAVFMHEIKNK